MDTEERVKVLEDEFHKTREELRQILLDIRTFLMEAQTPLRSDMNPRSHHSQSNVEKGVEPHGNR